MFNSKLIRRYTAPGLVPTPDQVQTGELVLNTTDATLYTKDENGVVQLIGTPAIQQMTTYVNVDLSDFQQLSTAIGHLPVGTGPGWLSLAPGADGTVLRADSTAASGVSWGTMSTIGSSGTTSPILSLVAAAGQLANSLQALDSQNVVNFAVTASGWGVFGTSSPNSNSIITAIDSDSAAIGFYASLVQDVQFNEAVDKYIIYGTLTPSIATGATEAGTSYGMLLDVTRSQSDGGSLSQIIAARLDYGPNHPSAAGSTTVSNYGLFLQPYAGNGTIIAQHDLHIATPIGTGGTIISHYAIYQADATATNYFAGPAEFHAPSVPVIFHFGNTDTPSAGLDLCPWNYVPYASTAARLTLSCLSAPAGNFTISILRSADGGTTFPDTVATVTIASGNRFATTTAIPLAALNAGDLLRLDVAAVNGAANWSAQLAVLSQNR